ncbi:hypothetical protein [Psychroserpens damuponensis]|uniref:hypothetical protein n=1 Tax=Psychroserpens damuponensis TaxID=943936 RepID=UPI00058C38D2|nr:hypothetical protein [Psychroserpens damuponensis]
MKDKQRWSEKPIPSFIIAIIGLLFIVFALVNLLGFIEQPMQNTSSILGLILGVILMYPIFKTKQK